MLEEVSKPDNCSFRSTNGPEGMTTGIALVGTVFPPSGILARNNRPVQFVTRNAKSASHGQSCGGVTGSVAQVSPKRSVA
jgi:hypothetical protein